MSAPYIGVQGMTPASNSDTLLYTLGDISDGSTGWAPGLPTQATSPSTARIWDVNKQIGTLVSAAGFSLA